MTSSNTNLGINLLISLLAKVFESQGKINEEAVDAFVDSISRDQTEFVYQAIRQMNPGGMEEVEQQDIQKPASESIRTVMTLAQDRDIVARQFTNGCADVIGNGANWLVEGKDKLGTWLLAIVWAQIRLMADAPDTLIVRKCGLEIGGKSQMLAQKAVDSGSQSPDEFWKSVSELDFWLRSDANRRNPGASADLVTASVFLGLLEGTIAAPFS